LFDSLAGGSTLWLPTQIFGFDTTASNAGWTSSLLPLVAGFDAPFVASDSGST
jgi:hypothetical protein